MRIDLRVSSSLSDYLHLKDNEPHRCRHESRRKVSLMQSWDRLDENKRGDDALFEWCLNNTGVVSNSTGRKPCKIGNDSSSNPNKVDATSALLTSLQLLQEARGNSMVSASKDNLIMINPFTDPMDWVAVIQGGTAAFSMMFTSAVEPNTGAIILQAI